MSERPVNLKVKKKVYMKSTSEEEETSVKRVGSEFQAKIPKLEKLNFTDIIKTDKDNCLWCSSILPEDEVVDYLKSVRLLRRRGLNEEKALIFLHRNNYDTEEALGKFKLFPDGSFTSEEWSENEARRFENGIEQFGKDFNSVQKVVQTKNIKEIVEFYYLWKKTERHDVFLKKKSASPYKQKQKKKMYLITDCTEYFEDVIDVERQVQTRSRSRLRKIETIELKD
ncbi:Mesoderm induction early response protein 1 like protein [Argiope bruennichi]|uniref:Mesoderm induction early response protein 1 like protein n=1 Tax=Argiope bruennichi TaxID=94029 RepID=A0A8T0E4V7_ARGBR|nr:Mesoderm induction early response protein 1 like protein [Argiope bruennichi]